MPARVHLLGVPIDALTLREAVERIHSFLHAPRQSHVVTPNSEMLVAAWHHQAFHALLRESALNLPDGAGLLWAARRTGQVLPERVTGVDTVTALCSELESEHPVFFLGGRGGVGAAAAEALRRRNSNLRIAGWWEGSPDDADAPEIIAAVQASGARLLLVAYGAPQQDLWIRRYLHAMPGIRVAMGVGGTFDVLAGRKLRAPQWLQAIGCEWLWRLLMEPWRIGRILTAVVVFPLLVLRHGKASPRWGDGR